MTEVVTMGKEKEIDTFEEVSIRLRKAKKIAALPVEKGSGIVLDVATPQAAPPELKVLEG